VGGALRTRPKRPAPPLAATRLARYSRPRTLQPPHPPPHTPRPAPSPRVALPTLARCLLRPSCRRPQLLQPDWSGAVWLGEAHVAAYRAVHLEVAEPAASVTFLAQPVCARSGALGPLQPLAVVPVPSALAGLARR
jgi:hypothetical protein